MKAMSRSLPIPSRRAQRMLGAALLVVATAACGGDEPAPTTPGTASGGASPTSDTSGGAAEPATPTASESRHVTGAIAGSVSGRVAFTGEAPDPAELTITGDAFCIGVAEQHPILDRSLVVTNGGLANAFVYIDVDTDAWTFDEASGAVVVDQVGCAYTPRVVGVRRRQDLTFQNSDQTLHNVHTTGTNKEINVATIAGDSRDVSFRKVEVMANLKCDVHPWMQGWIGVLDHPCFAVTDAQGRFSIDGVPPGEHTLKVWHEQLGEKQITVTVAEGQPATGDVTF